VAIRTRDELAELSGSFNHNDCRTESAPRDAIEEWTQTLEHRVQDRTKELQQVQDQLVHAGIRWQPSENWRPASLHEINNPLTGVLILQLLDSQENG